jgi:surfactin synthase thioesterase subunit
MADRIDLPYAVYGHSLGARLGFEVLRSLRALGVPPPVRFYPAASLPPDDPDTVAACVDLPDDEFLAVLIERLGAPTELRDVAELRQFQLPLLRHDLGWCHRYQYRPAPPLSTSIVAFAGVHDGVASPGKMAGWSRHGEHCRVEEVPGGHFFLRTASPHLTAMLTGDLHAALGVAAAGPGSI